VNEFNILFFNGQKLISGSNGDYTVSGGATLLFNSGFASRFSPVSGKITLTSGYADNLAITGEESFYRRKKFLPNATQYYINGIRQPLEYFIEHSHLSPISGTYIFAEDLDLINNNDIDDWTNAWL
jgi:hypothetical protein